MAHPSVPTAPAVSSPGHGKRPPSHCKRSSCTLPALAVIARLHLTSCTVSGWKTGVLAYGTTWVNAMDCRFEDNQVGFRFNAEGTVVTHTQYANNEFFHNGTAVLLESVPAESPLSFPGSVFEDNDTDIDNRCGREVNISQTTFR